MINTIKNKVTPREIKNEIYKYSPQQIQHELSSLCGNHLGHHLDGSNTPIFNPDTNKPIIRTIYGSGLKCFTSSCVPSQEVYNCCDIVIGFVENNGFNIYSKDDYILSVCLKYIGYNNQTKTA